MFTGSDCIRRQAHVESVAHRQNDQVNIWISKDLVTVLVQRLRAIARTDLLA
jgi:hypothetical protein